MPQCPMCEAVLSQDDEADVTTTCAKCVAAANSDTSEACGWEPVKGHIGHITLRLTVKCEHCDAPIPLNGPSEVVNCDACLKNSTLRRIYEELILADEGMKTLGSPYRAQLHKGPEPHCASCDTPIPLGMHRKHVGATTTLQCPTCGTGCPTYPAPAWLRAKLPMALQIFGGDAQTAQRQSGLPMTLATEAVQPIAMSCPKCAGGLTLGCDSERTTECPYCLASVFLPDGLWKSLHPVRTATRWTMTFKGSLKTVDTLATEAEAEEKAEEKREREREAAAQERKHQAELLAQEVERERCAIEKAENARLQKELDRKRIRTILKFGTFLGFAILGVTLYAIL